MPRILVVDDSRLTRRVIIGVLTAAGHEVVQAGDGEQGFALFQEQEFDCVISDLLMPVLDGFALAEKIRAVDSRIPLLVATADIQEHSRQRCKEIGVTLVLNKPLSRKQIVGAVDKAIMDRQTVES
ncbi:Sensor histidine kinase RcsC [Pseudobythopirellula maris]|uniref:Sensor histidine kinase RcsC n=1 Tax=Pseudobythopirellula maris TaxID=2527991 RepID=A0A5C5ZTV7_9BACT|nr:response regulator [Pseudobythopirellula maris]TWT90690.1 Sensor histidine kinase RcsC [Pseudobythopirellula maris]